MHQWLGWDLPVCPAVQGCRCRRAEPSLRLSWCRYRRRSRWRSQRMQEQQRALVTLLGVTDEWVTSTRTIGSFIRGGPCGASAVYSVPLRLACRTPKRVGAGSRSPFELSVGRIRLQSTSSVSLRINQSFSSANLFSMRRRVSATCRRCAHNSVSYTHLTLQTTSMV